MARVDEQMFLCTIQEEIGTRAIPREKQRESDAQIKRRWGRGLRQRKRERKSERERERK
jgi:hypothetical protein